MKERVITLLTENRVKLDEIGKGIDTLPKNRYVALAKTALELGRMYLGEVALDLGKEYPYEKTKEATKPEEIQPAVDLSDTKIELTGNEIKDINAFRKAIDDINTSSINNIITYNDHTYHNITSKEKFVNDCNVSQAYRSLKESRMWLGKRLGEIRDTQVAKEGDKAKG